MDSLGLKSAKHKSSPPTTSMEWLGYKVDSSAMKVSIPQDKLDQLVTDCMAWLDKTKASKPMIQSIVGRIIYVSNCVPQARRFTCHILATLRAMKDDDWVTLSSEFKADIRWFIKFGAISNGLFLLNPSRPTIEIQCNNFLFGGSGVSHPYCYVWTYTQSHMSTYMDIHQLEALNVLVAYQTLVPCFNLHPAYIIIPTLPSNGADVPKGPRSCDS